MARAGIGRSSGVRRGARVGLTEEEAQQGEATGVTQGETTTLGAGKQQQPEQKREQQTRQQQG